MFNSRLSVKQLCVGCLIPVQTCVQRCCACVWVWGKKQRRLEEKKNMYEMERLENTVSGRSKVFSIICVARVSDEYDTCGEGWACHGGAGNAKTYRPAALKHGRRPPTMVVRG